MTTFPISLKSDIARIAMLALAYYIAARLGDRLALSGGIVTLFWPPPGIALAAMLIYGRRLWPGVFVGAFFATLPVGFPPWVAAAVALGNVAALLFATFLLRRQAGFNRDLDSVQDVLRLVIFGALISTVISAVNNAFWLQWFDLQPYGQEYGKTLLHIWMGDALGIVLFTPALIAFYRPDTLQWTPTLRRSALLMYIALFVMCLLVFTDID
ncbi:MAG: MASE1 domain-containing protein, partial [Gallionellaceae bacterium]|nr:MASE1 domain-containing protein [Gallionellaceae bacterium]